VSSEEARKDELIKMLEAQVEKLTTDLANVMEELNKEIEDLKSHNEFRINNLNLQLEAANVKLREMHDFAMKKVAMEQELIAYVLIVETSHILQYCIII
jgi:archaellum component FlaC